MDDELGFRCYDTSDYSFYACNYGSSFLGCCSDSDEDEVCGEGCTEDERARAYFESFYFDDMTNVPSGQCDDGYEWYVCQSKIEIDDVGYSSFGCFLGDPCPDNSTAPVGSSRTPRDLIDYSPYSLIGYPGSSPTSTSSGAAATSVAVPSVEPSPKIFITVSATSGLQTSPVTPSATQLPSRSPTGAIVGGAIGGVAVAAMAIAIGFMAMYCLRRKGRQTSKTASSEKSGDSTSPTPVPAYSATDPNRVAQQPTQTAMPLRDVSSNPSRPCSELSSLGPAISPVPGVPTGLMRTGLIPYSPNQAQVEGTNLTNSSGAFPHAAPDAGYFGKAV